MKMKRFLLISIVSLLVVGGSYSLGWRKGYKSAPNSAIDTIKVVEYHRDTITLEKPLYFEKRITDTMRVAVTDTIRMRDTLYIDLPREERVYRDSLYMAVVSGFRPSLDRIDIYRTEKIVTMTVYKERKWGIGVAAGPSALIDFGGKAHLGIGATVGVRYNF